jgi:hypothetical protein
MNVKPFADCTGKASYQVAATIESYRKELKEADNGPADKNSDVDVIEVGFDNSKLTAKLGSNGNFQTRFEAPEGVSVNIVEKDPSDNRRLNLTSLTRSAEGTYTGSRTSASSASAYGLAPGAVPVEEAQFLFNLHEPGLKPTKL